MITLIRVIIILFFIVSNSLTMSILEEDSALILSSNGDVRGRKGLVQEVKRNTIDSLNDEPINKKIEQDTLWAFDANKRRNIPVKDYLVKTSSSTKNSSQASNLNGKHFTEYRNLTPIIENSTNTLRSSFSTSINSEKKDDVNSIWSEDEHDYRWDDMVQSKNKTSRLFYNKEKNVTLDSYSLNTKENTRVLQLPNIYTYDYGNTVIENIVPKSAKQWEAVPLNWDDIKPTYTTQSSRSSSIRSYKEALPVGKFAKQKFRILQDEEDYTENPKIYDVTNQQVKNLEKTCEFDCIDESVIMSIADFKVANVDIKIEEVKYSRKNVLDKLWSRKKTEILRSVNIDLFSSGQGKMLRSFIYDTMTHLQPLTLPGMSGYMVNVDEFQLTGQAAFTIFNLLLEIAEKDTSTISSKTQAYKNRFSPKYLLAILREEETIDYF